MRYHEQTHGELLERIYVLAQARDVQMKLVKEKRRAERARHAQAMASIRAEDEALKQRFAEALDEAARKKLSLALVAEIVGVSRERIRQIRKHQI